MNHKITTPNNFRDNSVIVLDSLDRDLLNYPSPSDYVIKLPSVLRNAETIELMSLQLTRTETNVNSGNNTFKLSIGVTNYTVTIAVAEYATGADLATAVAAAITAAVSGFTVSYSLVTRMITITHTNTIAFNITVGENCAKLLGIVGTGERGAGVVSSSGSGVLSGSKLVDLNGTDYLILSINDYTRIISASNTAHKNFLIVPMERYAVGQRFIIAGDEKEKKGIYILTNNQRNIFEMRVTIKRPDGSLYDFGKVDHFMTFRVYRDDYHDRN